MEHKYETSPFEIIDKMRFFGGQRAGRELWAAKPKEIQDADIASFNRDLDVLQNVLPKWISVEDRLPKGNGPYCQNVIVLTIKKEVMPGFCNHGLWYVMRPEDDYCNDADDGEVTHWMPLPEPPKE